MTDQRFKAISILSGGLDSAVSTRLAMEKHEVTLALFFDYGQRAALKEKQAALAVSQYFKVPLQEIQLPWLKDCTHTALVNRGKELPTLSSLELDQKGASEASAAQVWVPNRNGLFINIAACLAESLGAKILLTGFNREEAQTFPDNSAQFTDAISKSLAYSTQVQCRVQSFTLEMDKVEIVKKALELNFPLSLLWSCYEGGEKMCGKCESCLRSKRAYLENGLKDWMGEIFE